MTMQFIEPVEITTAMLISSTRAENDYTAWSGATTYADGDRAINTTTHRIYESVQGSNTNNDPTTDDGTWWVDVGPTNRWAMFDRTVGSITSQATPLTVVIDPGIVNSLALLDVSASSVQVTMTEGAGGPTVYDETIDMSETAQLPDWYSYFYDPIVARSSVILTDLPPYSNGRITVAITAGTTAECGTLALGSYVNIGELLYGVQVGIIDYSRKETDAYGVTDIVERGYAKRIDADVILSTAAIDYVTQKLAAIRATAVVWVGDSSYDSLIVYGWVRDWGVVMRGITKSEAHLQIEGLT